VYAPSGPFSPAGRGKSPPLQSLARRGCLLLSLALSTGPLLASETAWHRDWNAAASEAERTDRPILVVFTGSDWCPHCRLLEENVLATGHFRSWAADRFVFLEIDLPRQGIPQAVRDERSAVCRRFGVSSFPQVVVASPEGEKLAGLKGYSKQPADAWIATFSRQVEPVLAGRTTGMPPLRLASEDSRSEATAAAPTIDPLTDAVDRAGRSRRPVLVVVSRSSDEVGRTRAASLAGDPAFRRFVEDHFEMATVESPESLEAPGTASPSPRIDALLGGVPLPEHEVELIVTYDGHTPLYSQSGRQSPARIVSRLKWFLSAMSGLPTRSLVR
jgi:thioredoxin-related protein